MDEAQIQQLLDAVRAAFREIDPTLSDEDIEYAVSRTLADAWRKQRIRENPAPQDASKDCHQLSPQTVTK